MHMNKTSKIALALLFTLSVAGTVRAIPADPRPRTYVQANGQTITYRVMGDEYGHLAVTEDGYPITLNKLTGNYEYAVMKGGRIVSSGITATDASRRTPQVKAMLDGVDARQMLTALRAQSPMRTAQGKQQANQKGLRKQYKKMNDYPTLGFRHSPVFLLEFSDQGFTTISDPKAFYSRMLNQTGFNEFGGTGSAAQYYRENSHGLFTIEYDVIGPIRLSKPTSYYAETDERAAEGLAEACQIADSLGLVDFSQYDSNNDGVVDNIFFFYAGYAQSDTGDEGYIWPHSWNLTRAGIDLRLNGKIIDSYACSNEIRYDKKATTPQPTGVGTFIHEFGHVLGIPDLYSTTYNMLVYNIESWDLMSSGSYNNNMCTPPALSAYEKWSLGWEQPRELTLEADSLITLSKTQDGGSLMKTGPTENELFFFENRQHTGWDAYLPGHGMLIWHIDNDSVKHLNNNVNNDASHQCVGLAVASSVGKHAYDSYPGAGNVTETQLTDWDGNRLDLQPKYIEEHDSLISFVLDGVQVKVDDVNGLKLTKVTDEEAATVWDKGKNVSYYEAQLCEVKPDGSLSKVGEASKTYEPNIALDGLTPATDYQLDVTAVIGDSRSTAASIKFTTEALYFYKRKPIVADPTAITATGFTANWQPLQGATDYKLTVNSLTYSEQAAERGYDFSSKSDGMPSTWQSSSSSFSAVEGYYGAEPPSLRFGKDGDCLTMSYNESLAYGLKFWYRSAKASGKLTIEQKVNGQWVTVATIDNPSIEGETVEYNLDGATEVKLTYGRESGYLCIDDVVLSVKSIERKPCDGYMQVSTGGNSSLQVSGLEPSSNYSYVVKAVNNEGEESVVSDEMRATTLTADAINSVSTTGDWSVKGSDGQVAVCNHSQRPAIITVYGIAGDVVATASVDADAAASIALAKGIYIVKLGDESRKIVVN